MSPKRSASSAAARRSGSEGKSGGSGFSRSSSRAISREPCTRRPSTIIAGTVTAGKRIAFSTPLEITGSRSVRV